MVWGHVIAGGLGYLGAREANRAGLRTAAANRQLSREFAQNQIQWRVQDARKAGVHPSVAMGISPIGPATSSPSFQNELAHLGQGMSNATKARQTPAQRMAEELSLQKSRLENKLLETQIAGAAQALARNAPKPVPSHVSNSFPTADLVVGHRTVSSTRPSDDPSARINIRPAEVVAAHSPAYHSQEGGTHTSHAFVRIRNKFGQTGYSLVPSETAKERIEDDFLGGLAWHAANRFNPYINNAPPTEWLPYGYTHWKWDHVTQAYWPSAGGK